MKKKMGEGNGDGSGKCFESTSNMSVIKKIAKEFKEFCKAIWWLGEKPKEKSKKLLDCNRNMTAKQKIKDFLRRLQDRNLTIGDGLGIMLFLTFFIVMFLMLYTDFNNYPVEIRVICLFCVMAGSLFIPILFFSEKHPQIVVLAITFIIVAFSTVSTAYFFDILIGFDRKLLPEPEGVVIDPGTYPGIIVGLLIGFAVYKMLIKIFKK